MRLGVRLGWTSTELSERVVRLLQVLGLPVELKAGELEAATQIVSFDKKRKGSKIKFVFARAIGSVVVEPISLEHLRELMPLLADIA